MARRRISLTYMKNKSARKTTYKKRKQGLTKKMEEITTLCGIDGCIVISNPEEGEPHIWPSREKAVELFTRFESLPKAEQEPKKLDHEKFMTDRVAKLREQIARQEKKNKEAKASLIMYQMSKGKKMEELNLEEVELLLWYSDMKLKAIKRQNLLLPPIKHPARDSSPPPPPPTPAFSLPPSVMQPSHVAGKGVAVGGSAKNGGNLQLQPPCKLEDDPLFREMFRYEGAFVGSTGMRKGESSNGVQHNNLGFPYGFGAAFSSSFPGFR